MQQQLNVGKFKIAGFTIVEIMTVVVIASMLITAAIPSFQDFIRNNQAVVMASRIASALRIARAEAIKRGIPVTVCPISSSFNPTADFNESTEQWACQSTTSWDAWKVMEDPNLDQTEDFSDGWPVIRYSGNIVPGSITSNISGGITFDPMGFANLDLATTRSGWTWSSSYSSGEWSWSYAYSSSYSGDYYRLFTIVPSGCSGTNARAVEVTQNGIVTVLAINCYGL